MAEDCAAGTYIGGLFGALVFLVIAVNVTLYLHKRAWSKRKIDQAWVTLSNCLCRVREGLRRLVNQMPNLSSTGADRLTTVYSVQGRPRDDDSPKYVNLLPTVHPINNANDSSDSGTSEDVQTRSFGRRPTDEPIYCLSTLAVTPSFNTSSPTTSAQISGHQRNDEGNCVHIYNATARYNVPTTTEQRSNTGGSWPGREGSKTKTENLKLANQPLERGLVSKHRPELQVRVPPKYNRLKTTEKISACSQPGDSGIETGMALGGKACKSIVTNESLTEVRRKLESNKLKSVVKGRATSESVKIQPKFSSPISFPGAKTGLYAVGDVEHRQNKL